MKPVESAGTCGMPSKYKTTSAIRALALLVCSPSVIIFPCWQCGVRLLVAIVSSCTTHQPALLPNLYPIWNWFAFGEGFTVDWGLRKCHHYLWDMWNIWITHQYVFVFSRNFDGNNRPICRLQMRIMMMQVNMVHTNTRFLGDPASDSRKGGNRLFDPLISQHDAFVATLHKNYAAPDGPLLLQNMPGFKVSGKHKTTGNSIDTSVRHILIGAAKRPPSMHSLFTCPSIIKFHSPTEK